MRDISVGRCSNRIVIRLQELVGGKEEDPHK